jgi:hypothetical protein
MNEFNDLYFCEYVKHMINIQIKLSSCNPNFSFTSLLILKRYQQNRTVVPFKKSNVIFDYFRIIDK